jgi:excinuclease ABC subunit C
MIDLKQIPTNPGCYLFKNKKDKIIYIGKAKNLKKRVSNYFQKKDHDPKTRQLVTNIASVEFFITDNEIESLLLENNLIKKHKPKYNINLKDSKRYAYIKLTSEEFPRLLLARERKEKAKYFGPFISGAKRDHVLQTLRRTFKIRTCNKLPKKECLRYSLGLCSAPCIKKISKANYSEDIHSAEMVLRGKTNNLNKILFDKMKNSSSKLNFERAMEYKKQLESLKYLKEKQIMERQKNYDEDLIDYIIKDDIVFLTLFNSKKGILENKQDFEFDITKDILEQFIKMYYSDNKIPKEIIIPHKIDPSIKEYLGEIKKQKVILTVPKTGEKKKLLNLIKTNIELNISGKEKRIEDLKNVLNLNETPNIIECFDISHLSGTKTVASMVQFKNGKANKSNYRKFRIRETHGIDDYGSLKEVVRRRYTGLIKNKLPMPDLIIIDGGKGQLSSCIEELEILKITTPIISIAKREEEIFTPNNPESIILDSKQPAINLVKEIRDEAHRFAINYNRLLRRKEMLD